MIPRRFFWTFDLAVFCLAFSAAYRIAPYLITEVVPTGPLLWAARWPTLPPWAGQMAPAYEYVGILLTVALTTIGALAAFGAHSSLLEQSVRRIVFTGLAAPLIGLGVVTLGFYALRTWDWSRLFVFSFIGLSTLSLIGYRLVLRAYFARRLRSGVYARNYLLIGPSSILPWLAESVVSSGRQGERRVIGWLRPGKEYEGTAVGPVGAPCLGDVHVLNTLLIRRPIHDVIAIQPVNDGSWIEDVIQHCDQVGVRLHLVPEALLCRDLTSIQAAPGPGLSGLPAVVLSPIHFDSDALFVKRLLDILVSAALLVLLSPIFAVIALLIKVTSRGPVFYGWHVVGEQGREFTGFKFRTMVVNADALKAQLASRNEMKGPVFKIRDDPRITPLGRILRKYSLDELPQLYSVLKGDMSLVGPRPAFRTELERYEFWQMRKLSARPGITCLWQVQGRNKIVDFDEWVRLDLEYIDNWSLWLDLKILARTAWTVVAGTGV